MINITNTIIVINIIMFLLQQQIPSISLYFGMNYLFFKEDLWIMPLSSMFLHGSFMHLGFNMVALFQLGTITEEHMGKVFFLSSYILGGILVSILSLLFSIYMQTDVNIIGASGAICVIAGIFGFFNKIYFKGLFVAILLMSFAPLLMGMNIAWYAHIIGFALGVVIAFAYKRINYGV